MLANGETIKNLGKVQIYPSLDIIPGTIYRLELMIIEGTTNEIALGTKFLGENGVMIDFEDGILRIDGNESEMPGFDHSNKDTPDEKVLEMYRSVSEDKLKELVKELILKNPGKGEIIGYEHSIELTSEVPVQGKRYTIPMGLYERTKKEIESLIKKGVIRKSYSRYANPSFVLEKKNGDVRIITDFRELNKVVKRDMYPFSSVDDQLKVYMEQKFSVNWILTKDFIN